jgi:hypothetical protein
MENTARNFALQLGSLISLYVSIGALLTLLFSVINAAYPDVTEYYYYFASDYGYTIRAAIATLIVFFPAYLLLTRIVNKVRRAESGTYTAFTKWLLYLSLVVGGGVLLGDLVAILLNFLNGELTIRFLLKAVAVFGVVGAAFAYYALDARGYWHTHEIKSKRYGFAAALVVVAAIVLGFMNTQSPADVRQHKIDERTVNDLSSIESMVQEYHNVEGVLPASIEMAYRSLPHIPTAPEGRSAYTYTTTGALTYELCGEFAYASESGRDWYTGYAGTWAHDKGIWCFKRTVFDLKD